MTTLLYVDEQSTKPNGRDTPTIQLVEVRGEEVRNFARGRIWAEVSKQTTKDGIVTTINVTFYDSDNLGILATVHGTIEGANLHLHGDFSKNLADVTLNGGTLSVSPD